MHILVTSKQNFSLHVHIIVTIETFLLIDISIFYFIYVGPISFRRTFDFMHKKSFLCPAGIVAPIGLPMSSCVITVALLKMLHEWLCLTNYQTLDQNWLSASVAPLSFHPRDLEAIVIVVGFLPCNWGLELDKTISPHIIPLLQINNVRYLSIHPHKW